MTEKNDGVEQHQLYTWEQIIGKHQHYIFNLAFHLCHNKDDAEDIMQETFLKAFKTYGNFRGEASVRTWLSRIVINTFIDNKRKAVKHEPFFQSDIILSSGSSPERVIIKGEMQRCIHHVLQYHLPEKYKTAIVLRDIYGFSYAAIAEILRITVASVKSRLHRGRKRYLEHLQKSGCVAFIEDYSCYCEEAKGVCNEGAESFFRLFIESNK